LKCRHADGTNVAIPKSRGGSRYTQGFRGTP